MDGTFWESVIVIQQSVATDKQLVLNSQQDER